jgi:hypothetical protein
VFFVLYSPRDIERALVVIERRYGVKVSGEWPGPFTWTITGNGRAACMMRANDAAGLIEIAGACEMVRLSGSTPAHDFTAEVSDWADEMRRERAASSHALAAAA